MNTHRYILEPYKGINTRYLCPVCKSREKTFSRYIDTKTGEYIAPTVGRCNRESNCGYHYTPKQYFQDNHISIDTPQVKPLFKPHHVTPQQKPVSFIPVGLFKASLQNHEPNNFIKFLLGIFGVEVTRELISNYFIATSTHWNGATIFWQIDIKGKIRTGKIMLYSPSTGKRVKEPYNHITWVHTALKQSDFELKQCLFGEHLLQDKHKPVAIVESEKTAIIASIYFPQLIWLAVGSLTNLNAEKCQVLKGRKVTLFPDLNGFEKWSSKAKELSHLATFAVSELLEQKASNEERKLGFDLADYLIKFDYPEFASPEAREHRDVQPNVNVKSKKQADPIYGFSKPEKPKRENWEQEISKLEHLFMNFQLPTPPVQLNSATKIIDVSKFIQSHLSIVKAQNGNPRYLPYLNRLTELEQYLTINLN
jgi:rubredoxin